MTTYKKTIVGVMGASHINEQETQTTQELARLVAQEGWIVLTGGGQSGVMGVAMKAAVEAGGETIGMNPGTKRDGCSEYATIPVFTSSGGGRNYMNIISSDVVVVPSHVSEGTLTEVAYALSEHTPLILISGNREDTEYIKRRGGDLVFTVDTPEQAIEIIKQLVG